MSVRHQPADTTSRGAPTRRPHLATPIGVSLVAVLAVAVVAVAIILGPRGLFGFGAASPTLSPSDATASPISPHEPPTPTPTATPPLTPTAAPTPTPSPAWMGLEWTAGPSTSGLGGARVNEVAWWNGRYVGVGSVVERGPLTQGGPDSDLRIAPAFFVAEAASDWQLVQQGEWESAGVEDSEYAALAHLVDHGDALLAISDDSPKRGSPSLWSSTDGLLWSSVDSASWRESWAGASDLVAVDAGPSGVVAIGFEGGGCCMNPAGVPVVAYSADGRTWQRISSPALTDRALLHDVAATDDGFVIVGALRAPEDPAQMPAEVGAPAAWVSRDGLSWDAAHVGGAEVVGGGLMHIAVAADGLFATGIAEPHRFPWEGATHGWWSTDGRAWTMAGALGTELPPGRVVVSDRERIISFGSATPTSPELAAWTSTNGSSWSPLAFSGATERLPLGAPQEDVAGGMPAIWAAWMVPDGVLIPVTVAIPAAGQALWFGAVVP